MTLTVQIPFDAEYTSESLNKTNAKIRGAGIYAGFGVQAGAGLSFNVIPYKNNSVLVVEYVGLNMSVHSGATENVPVTPKESLQYLVLELNYSTVAETTAELKIVDALAINHVVLAGINVPDGASSVDASMIDFSYRQWSPAMLVNLERQELRKEMFVTDSFIGDGFLPLLGGSVKAGVGVVNGLYIKLEADLADVPKHNNENVYVDAYYEPDSTISRASFDVRSEGEDLSNYTDAFGIEHALSKLAWYVADGTSLLDQRVTTNYDLVSALRTEDLAIAQEVRDGTGGDKVVSAGVLFEIINEEHHIKIPENTGVNWDVDPNFPSGLQYQGQFQTLPEALEYAGKTFVPYESSITIELVSGDHTGQGKTYDFSGLSFDRVVINSSGHGLTSFDDVGFTSDPSVCEALLETAFASRITQSVLHFEGSSPVFNGLMFKQGCDVQIVNPTLNAYGSAFQYCAFNQSSVTSIGGYTELFCCILSHSNYAVGYGGALHLIGDNSPFAQKSLQLYGGYTGVFSAVLLLSEHDTYESDEIIVSQQSHISVLAGCNWAHSNGSANKVTLIGGSTGYKVPSVVIDNVVPAFDVMSSDGSIIHSGA